MSGPELGGLLGPLVHALDLAGIGVLAFVVKDGQFTRMHANDAGTRPLGYTAAEWLALPMWGSLDPEQRPLVERVPRRDMAMNEAMGTGFELKLRHRDGSTLHGEFTASHGDAPGGGMVIVLVARDVGPRLQAQLSLLEADRIALVGALSAGFAHEINNPLTSVVLNLRSLRKQIQTGLSDPALALRCVDDVTLASERIASNVRALQTLATPGTSMAIDLGAVVTSALRLASPTLEPRAMVHRRIAATPQVSGEESRVGQAVLAMLLFSSSGFADGGTRNEIEVVVEARGDYVVVEVSDNGRALSPEESRHAFDPFYRSSARGAGVGVGLGVARSIALTLGGDLVLTANPEAGVVMTMRLPPVVTPAPPS